MSDPIKLRGIGTTAQRSGKFSYTITLPKDAADMTFTVTVTGTGVNTATKSYIVSMKILSSLAPKVTSEVIKEALPPGNFVIDTAPITGAVTAASENNVVRGVVGAISLFAVSAVILRSTVRKQRNPWKTGYYTKSRNQDIVDKMKNVKKNFFKNEKWVGKI